jgi:hypothetical protein
MCGKGPLGVSSMSLEGADALHARVAAPHAVRLVSVECGDEAVSAYWTNGTDLFGFVQ